MEKTNKALNFDLITNELNKYFKDTREPYNKIKNFMLANGFEPVFWLCFKKTNE